MANEITKRLPSDFGFALLVFPFKKLGEANYVSSASRKDTIEALREAAERLERNEVYDTPENNIY